MPLRRVVQEDEDGCGLACIAMLLGVSYSEAKALCSHSRTGKTWTHELRAALRRYGVRTAEWLEPIDEPTLPSLLGIAILQSNYDPDEGWHWAIWDGLVGRILDPKPVPYRRLRVNAFLAVGDLCRQGALPGL